MKSLLIAGGILWDGVSFLRGSAVLLSGEKIVAVGPEEELRSRAPGPVELLRLSGETVLPGVADGHIHLTTWAKQQSQLDLSEAKSVADVLRMVRTASESLPPGRWIRGWNYNETRWPDGRTVTRQDLDGLAIPNPILLQRVCTHINVADSKALTLSNLRSDDGVLLERDGIQALKVMERNVFSREGLKSALRKGCFELARWGVTTVHPCGADDYGMEEDLSLYGDLHREGALPVRVFSYHDAPPCPVLPTGFGDGWVHYQGLKIYLDGSLGGRTAALTFPYSDDWFEEGRLNWTDEAVYQRLRFAREKGIQTMLHAIGDRGLDQGLRCIAQVDGELGKPRLRERMNHVMVCRPDQRLLLADLGLFCDIQPSFVPSDMNMAAKRLGESRLPWGYAWRSLMDEGLVLSASSDAPVETVNPWMALWALEERRDWEEEHILAPEERLSVEEALPLFTWNPHRATGQGHRLGRLAPGYEADIAVVDRDISEARGRDLRETSVRYTFAGGRLSHGTLPGWPRFGE